MPLPSSVDARLLWSLYWAAAATFLFTIGLPYIGEEGVYTITSIEMKHSGDWLNPTLYGGKYGRGPALNWAIVPLADALGWDRMLAASRIVAAIATVLTGLTLAWLAHRLTREPTFAALCALVYLTSDALLYRGWLAYADPLFSAFTFGAIACLWVGAKEGRGWLFLPAVLLVSLAGITKIHASYLFYAVTGAALLIDRDCRRKLLGPASIGAHLLGVALFLGWNQLLTGGTQQGGTVVDVAGKLRTAEVGPYLLQLLSFPPETIARFLPASVLALWYWRSPDRQASATLAFPAGILALATLVNYLPYWLFPKSAIRYIMPLYPMMAALIAWAIWRAGPARLRVAVKWLIALIALKYVIALWAYPAYQTKFRGDFAGVAREVAKLTKGFPLHVTDVSATGLAVAANLDSMRYPDKPITWPPKDLTDGFVLAYRNDEQQGRPFKVFMLGRNELHLLCRGAACGR